MLDDQVSAVFLLRADGAALMQHRDDKPGLRHAGMWVPPGGHRESGEDAVTCARREFFEETGYQCGQLEQLCVLIDEQPGWPPFELTVFLAPYDSEQSFECLEGQALQFITRAEADMQSIPEYLINLWDQAILEAASLVGERQGA
jgi:8-oxo-dGTP pyrophosphatase MutT (NUDIX family)